MSNEKSIKLNISIDDVTPHPKSSARVLEQCFKSIERYPEIKFTLFIPTAYWRTTRPDIATQEPLSISKFPSFCEAIRSLPRSNFEVGYHGHYHGIPGKTDNDELAYIDYSQACNIFSLMLKEVKDANLEGVFKRIIRPPAWRMSPDAIRAARDIGFEVLALSPDDYCMKVYGGEQNNKKDVVYYNSAPPIKPLNLFEKSEIVYHACEWDRNYLSQKAREDLENLIEKCDDQISFCFIGGLL